MYAREVSMNLKPNAGNDFTRTIENSILPLLRKQKGFTDELTLVAPGGRKALGISFWDRKESADAYARDAYPQVLKDLTNVVDGTPLVESYEVSNSTVHKIASKK